MKWIKNSTFAKRKEKNMKKFIMITLTTIIILVLIPVVLFNCKNIKESKVNRLEKDSINVIGMGNITIDSFEKIKGSLIHDKSEACSDSEWFTKELWLFNIGYPDTIKVMDENGDSVDAIRHGLIPDDKGDYYSPAYIVGSYFGGDVYDVNGKYVGYTGDLDI